MYEIDSHSKEFDKDFKRLARYDRALARELMEPFALPLERPRAFGMLRFVPFANH